MRRGACKVDANHAAVVKALRAAGAYVIDMSAVGKGFPDLLVVRAGHIYLLEVKDGAKCPSARRLTADQMFLHTNLFGHGVTVHVVLSVGDALRAIGVMA